jgi:hypothetical protein
VAVAAVGVARLAAWALGVLLRFPLGERRRLALARPVRLLERSFQLAYPLRLGTDRTVFLEQFLLELGHGLAETGHDLLQFGNTLLQAHATLLAGRWALSGK